MFLLLCLYMQQTNFWMKNRIVLFVAGCIALFLSSCLDSDEREYERPKDCQIMTFKLANDSVVGVKLDTVKFVIDQVNGRIFNPDSLPFGTVVGKVVCNITYNNASMANIEVTQDALPDSTFNWNTSDSLDFSKPVKFVTTAFDGITKKTYLAQVNIHQLVPDSMTWELYATDMPGFPAKEQKVIVRTEGDSEYYYMYAQAANTAGAYSLYRSAATDARSWTELSLEGLPAGVVRLAQMAEYENTLYVPTTAGALYQSADGQSWTLVDQDHSIKTVLGVIKDGGLNQPSALAVIIDNNGTLNYAAMNNNQEWTTGDVVPEGFPVSGFGSLSSQSMFRENLTVVAGRDKDGKLLNSAWATMTGTSWILLTDMESTYFTKREGILLSAYDNKFCMIGGIDESNKAMKDLYFSIDAGVTWTLSDTLTVMPQAYTARGFSSVAVDKDNFMLIFGGKENTNANNLDQIWRGRINRLGFKD